MSVPDDRYPGSSNDLSASPWGIPASSSPTPAAGGHLPAFGIPQLQPPEPPRSEPEGFTTQIPLPPSMQSPYGAPLQPGLALPTYENDDYDAGAKRRKTLLVSGLAAVAVVGVGVSVAFLSGGSSPQKAAALAGASHDSTTPSQGASSESTGKPDGDTQAGAGQVTTGGAMPVGISTSGVSTTPGQPVPSSSAGAKPGGPASVPGTSAAHPSSGPGTSARPAGPPSSGAVAPPSTLAKPPVSPPPASVPKPPPPPSSDCTYLDLPAAQMPVISQAHPGSAAAVKQLQCLMKKSELGIKPLVIDGVWGAATQSALTGSNPIGFQQCNNAPTVHSPGGNPPYVRINTSGVVDAQTWADLYFWDNQYFGGVSYYCNGTR